MPNEEDKTTVETGENSESAGGAEAKGGGRKKLIMFGLVGVGAIVIGVVLALFVLKPMMAPSEGDGNTTAQVENEQKEEPKEEKHRSKDSQGEGGEALMYTINDIVINPAGTGGSRFLSVSFGFELESPRLLSEFKAREPMIRDALITILSSKTVAQLTDVRQKEIIRYQIKKRVGELMKTESLAGVYYTDFVLQ